MIILLLTYYSCYASYLLSTSPSRSLPQNTGPKNSSADDVDDHDENKDDDVMMTSANHMSESPQP